MITFKSMTMIGTTLLEALPLTKGQSRVCRLGCGQNVVTAAGNEREAVAQMRLHAEDHGPEITENLRSRGDWVGYLVTTITWALAPNEFRKRWELI